MLDAILPLDTINSHSDMISEFDTTIEIVSIMYIIMYNYNDSLIMQDRHFHDNASTPELVSYVFCFLFSSSKMHVHNVGYYES